MAPLCSVAFGEEGALEELGGAEALSGIPVAHTGTEIISLDAALAKRAEAVGVSPDTQHGLPTAQEVSKRESLLYLWVALTRPGSLTGKCEARCPG
jgi:hypothetical protein